MVGEIVRDIAEMSQFARASRFDPSSVKVAVSKANGPADAWSATVTVPGRAPLAVELPLRTGVWSPEEYEPLARTLVEGLGGKETPSTDETLLGTLRDLRAAVIERENQRISKRLEQGMSSSTAHEEAALLVGAFALREAAGWFSDHRQLFCGMTAHLAVADALRVGPERGIAGRYAYTTLLILSRRTAEGLGVLDTLDRRAGDSPIQAAWSRALRLRATDDWRMLGQPKSRSLLERLEYYRALVNSSMEALALSMARDDGLAPVADWGRITTARTVQVEEGHRFLRPALDQERAEIAEVREASGLPPLTGARLVEALNAPAGRCLTHAGPRVIGWGTWAAFVQRHIGEHVHRVDLFIRRSIDLEQAADASQAQLDRDSGGLVLFPMAACFRTRGQEQNFDRIKDAIDVALARPELMVALNWAHLESGTRYEVLERGMARSENWFTTGLPRGTVYDSAWRLERLRPPAATRRACSSRWPPSIHTTRPSPLVASRRSPGARRRPRLFSRPSGRGGLRPGRPGRGLERAGQAAQGEAGHRRTAVRDRHVSLRAPRLPPVLAGARRAGRGLLRARHRHAVRRPCPRVARRSLARRLLPEAWAPAEGVGDREACRGDRLRLRYNAMAQHFEAVGRFDQAERYHVEGSDRYEAPSMSSRFQPRRVLLPYGARAEQGHVRAEAPEVPGQDVPAGPAARGAEGAVRSADGWGLRQRPHRRDAQAGDLGGRRHRGHGRLAGPDPDQYWPSNGFTPDVEDMTFIVWKAGAYREIKAKFRDRSLSVNLDNYPLKGWVEK